MKAKTAVDYIDSVLIDLIEKFNSKEYEIARNTLMNFKNVVIEQAKEMEKEQIIEFANKYANSDSFYCSGEFDIEKCAEQYYNKTFKSE